MTSNAKTPVKSTNPDRTAVAQDIFTYCTKEKIDTFHVVMNHNAAGIVDRVKCKACGSEHKYKKAPVPKTPASARTNAGVLLRKPGSDGRGPAAAAATSEALTESWLGGLKKWGNKEVRSFDPALYFKVGEVFEHGTFGKGVVQARRENKIDVLFREGIKTLPSKPHAPN